MIGAGTGERPQSIFSLIFNWKRLFLKTWFRTVMKRANKNMKKGRETRKIFMGFFVCLFVSFFLYCFLLKFTASAMTTSDWIFTRAVDWLYDKTHQKVNSFTSWCLVDRPCCSWLRLKEILRREQRIWMTSSTGSFRRTCQFEVRCVCSL